MEARRSERVGGGIGLAGSGVERAVANLDRQVRPLLRPRRRFRRFRRLRRFFRFRRLFDLFGFRRLFDDFRRLFDDAVQIFGVVAAVDFERLLSNEFLTFQRNVGQTFGVVVRQRRDAVVDSRFAWCRRYQTFFLLLAIEQNKLECFFMTIILA